MILNGYISIIDNTSIKIESKKLSDIIKKIGHIKYVVNDKLIPYYKNTKSTDNNAVLGNNSNTNLSINVFVKVEVDDGKIEENKKRCQNKSEAINIMVGKINKIIQSLDKEQKKLKKYSGELKNDRIE